MNDIYEYERIRTKIRKQAEIMRGYSFVNKLRSSFKITRAWRTEGDRVPFDIFRWCIESIWIDREIPY